MRVTYISFYYLFNVNRDHIFEGHNHNNFEANVVLSGELEVTIQNNVIKLTKGDMIFWPADMTHNNRALEDGTRFIAVHFGLSNNTFIKNNIVFRHLGQDELATVKLFMNEAQKGSSPKNGLADIAAKQDEAGKPKDGAAAIPLLESLILLSVENSHNLQLSEDFSAQVFRRAFNAMNSNLSSELTVPEIAKLCGVCQTTLKKAFSRHAGKGIKKYYNELRIEAAKNMLESGKNITETAFSLGFSSSSYFSQFFKNNTGENPKVYLKR
ncbi:MAG: AraC family transcriptional regulator [Clostridia bacterium]|nr:AraC family transcriptional regulator [Clostridia bacterium]